MNDAAIVKAEHREIAQTDEASLMQVIANAAKDPSVDAEKAERMFALYERMVDRKARTEFFAALSALQAELPQIRKDGRIVVGGTERSRYARLEDIDVAIRPLLTKHGFAFSFDSKSTDGKSFILSCKLSHMAGHAETKELPLPLDKAAVNREGRPIRSEVQDVGSTVSYGRRTLIKMHLNLVERGEDDGGQGAAKPITPDQAKELLGQLTALHVNQPAFLKYMRAEKIEAILETDWQKSVNWVMEKKRNGNP